MDNPHACLFCGNVIPKDKNRNTFCNHNCRALYWNSKRVITNRKGNPIKNRSKYEPHPCEFCGSLTTKKRFCSRKCNGWWNIRKHVESGSGVSKTKLRMYLILVRGHKCEYCGGAMWKNVFIPLETHHINGKYEDNSIGNLQLLCPNCHALTDNYKARNKGNGRPYIKYR